MASAGCLALAANILRGVSHDETISLCALPLTVVYYVLQSILLGAASYVAYHCLALKLNILPESRSSPANGLAVISISLVAGVLLHTFLGVSSIVRKNRSLGNLYIFSTIVGILLAVCANVLIGRQLLKIEMSITTIWNGLSNESKSRLQTLANCCGLREPQDRAALPCPLDQAGGCVPAGAKSPLLEWIRGGVFFALTLIITLPFVLGILNILVLFVHEPRVQIKEFIY